MFAYFKCACIISEKTHTYVLKAPFEEGSMCETGVGYVCLQSFFTHDLKYDEDTRQGSLILVIY